MTDNRRLEIYRQMLSSLLSTGEDPSLEVADPTPLLENDIESEEASSSVEFDLAAQESESMTDDGPLVSDEAEHPKDRLTILRAMLDQLTGLSG